MITDLYYVPKKQNHIPEIIFSCSTAVLVLSTVCMMLNLGPKLLWNTVFILMAVCLTYLATRYMTSSYRYTISYENKMFIVDQKVGKKLTTLCRMDLNTLTAIRLYRKEDDKYARTQTRYSYCNNIAPKESYLVTFTNEDMKAMVRIECDDAFYNILKQISDENNAATVEDVLEIY